MSKCMSNYVPNSLENWIGRKKTKSLHVMVDEYTNQILKEMSNISGSSKSDVVRRAIYFMRILLDPNLILKDLVTEENWTKNLGDVLIPIPILATLVQMDFGLWDGFNEEK